VSIAESLKEAANAVVQQQQVDMLAQNGYVYDPTSGLHYHAESGYYYDTVSYPLLSQIQVYPYCLLKEKFTLTHGTHLELTLRRLILILHVHKQSSSSRSLIAVHKQCN